MSFDGRIRGDSRHLPIASESIQCVITSPPYYGLRDYGQGGQLGLERTPADYVDAMVNVFDEVWRVLKTDGTLWLNLGDSYAGSWGAQSRENYTDESSTIERTSTVSARQILSHPKMKGTGSLKNTPGLKQKDLIGIPWKVAFALQARGWYLRSDIIWAKKNGMPESVMDRPTRAHEYVFLLSKSERYHYDGAAIAEPTDPTAGRDSSSARRQAGPGKILDSGFKQGRRFETRSKRDVWHISTSPYPEAHYATFPPKLVEPCLLAGSRPGDFVLDPFAGSGTVAMVAEQHSRKGISVDLGYQDLQKKRMLNVQKHLLSLGAEVS